MAAKKKSAPATMKSNAKTPAKPPGKAAASAAPKTAKPSKTAKPVKAAKVAAPVKAAKVAAPVKAAKVAAPVKATKPSKPAKTKDAAAPTSAALEVGSRVPAFDLFDETGARIASSTLAGKPYLLYFYPKDDTPGCTKEACDIRDNFGRFGKQGLRVLGVSPDSQQSHAKFGKKYGLPFTLLSDPDKTLANAYGVWGPKKNYGKEYMGIVRSSFLVGADGKLKKSYRGVRVEGHVDAVLEDAKSVL
jgi:thioredoxin-dependent peroxiredoxin